ncbi:MAG: hypothetical protein ACT4OK_11635 [Gemmobacter sp.]
MLVIHGAGLVILEVPKTGSQALRALLGNRARANWAGAPRHIGIGAYHGKYAAALAAEIGRAPETVAVIRDPIDRLQSWHRYLQRDRVAGGARSTRGIGFDAFVQAVLSPDPPPHARVGRQDRQVGWDGARAAVDHLFAYDRLDLLLAFLSPFIPRAGVLPARNLSPRVAAGGLSPATEAALRDRHAAEFALYAAVVREGYLGRG